MNKQPDNIQEDDEFGPASTEEPVITPEVLNKEFDKILGMTPEERIVQQYQTEPEPVPVLEPTIEERLALMSDQMSGLMQENKKLKKMEKAAPASPTEKPLSFQEKMIKAAKELELRPISESMRAHAFSQQGSLACNGLDPSKHYHWVSKMDDKLKGYNGKNVAMRKSEGFAPVQDPDSKIDGPRFSGSSQLETHDLVLCETSHEQAVSRAMLPAIKAKTRLNGVKNEAENIGLKGKMKGEKRTYENDLQMANDDVSLFDVDSMI